MRRAAVDRDLRSCAVVCVASVDRPDGDSPYAKEEMLAISGY
jgi:hypothetical protein